MRGVIYLIRQSAAHIFYRALPNIPTAATASGEARTVSKLRQGFCKTISTLLFSFQRAIVICRAEATRKKTVGFLHKFD